MEETIKIRTNVNLSEDLNCCKQHNEKVNGVYIFLCKCSSFMTLIFQNILRK